MRTIIVYYQEANLSLEVFALKIFENRAVILLQDRISIAELIDEVWTISGANKIVLDLCDII